MRIIRPAPWEWRYRSLVLFFFFILPITAFADQFSRYPQVISPREAAIRVEEGTYPLVLDVRSPQEFEAGHLKGAVNIDFRELPYRTAEIARFKELEVLLYCRTGRRAQIALSTLQKEGFTKIVFLEGQYQEWIKRGLPLER